MTKLYLAKYSKLQYIIAKKQSHFFLRNNVKENYLLSLYSLPVCYLSEVIKCEGKTLVKGNYDTSAVQSNKAAFILLVSWSRHLPCTYLPHTVSMNLRDQSSSAPFPFPPMPCLTQKRHMCVSPVRSVFLAGLDQGKQNPGLSVELVRCQQRYKVVSWIERARSLNSKPHYLDSGINVQTKDCLSVGVCRKTNCLSELLSLMLNYNFKISLNDISMSCVGKERNEH